MTPQRITVVNKTHPITQGLGDRFDIIDESYACPYYEDSVTPLLRTDFKPADHNRNLSPNWKYSNLAAWVKTRGEQPDRLHPDGPWPGGVGQRVVSQARAECDQVGRVAGSAGVGEGESEADFQVVDELGGLVMNSHDKQRPRTSRPRLRCARCRSSRDRLRRHRAGRRTSGAGPRRRRKDGGGGARRVRRRRQPRRCC